MIYFYKPISAQPIENMHSYMHHFFHQLFNGGHAAYTHANFIHLDFLVIVTTYSEQIDDKLSAVFNAYSTLLPNEKTIVQAAYDNNNKILEVCNKTVRPYKYEELPAGITNELKALYDSIGVLYKMLTSKKAYQPIKNKCGDLKTHFEAFRKVNEYSVCPFCGMENLLTEYDKGKNEYDHYISKGDYPFCSINFKNLAPVCDYCNKGDNKGQKDIPFLPRITPQVQEEIYYPYDSSTPDHEIKLKIISTNTDLSTVASWSLDIDCLPITNRIKKDRWVEIYNIDSRYKSKISKDSKTWKGWIHKKYYTMCKKHNTPYNIFEEDAHNENMDYKNKNNGILMKTFYDFILNDPNCEANLKGVV